MIILDPGHIYGLTSLDKNELYAPYVELRFVKREGENYPGNVGSYPGTNMQEVLRALIDRVKYLDNQIPDHHNDSVLFHLRSAIFELEMRAAARHGRVLPLFDMESIENQPVCGKCGHIGCDGTCH